MKYQPSADRYSKMQYKYCGNSGLLLPRISLGLWHNFGSVDDFGVATDMIKYAFDSGVTHFDLANNYGPVPGSAEINFGKILKEHFQGYRDELIISSKAGHEMWNGPYGGNSSRKNLMASIDQSLCRTGLDYFDIFYSHRYDGVTPVEETMQALIDIVKQGKALYVGISKYPPMQAKVAYEILRSAGVPCLISQYRYSMFDRAVEEEVLPLAAEQGSGFIAFSPLAQGLLPAEVTKVGVTTQKRQNSMLMVFSLYDETDSYNIEFIENYANINLIPEIKRVKGVGDANVLGQDYSMRIWLKPDVMAQYKLIPTDVSAALAEQNIEAAPGQFGERGNQTFQYTIRYKGRLQQTTEFEDIVIKALPDGNVLRLGDVADIELGRLAYTFNNMVNGHKAVSCIVYQMAGTNATETISNLEEVLAKAQESLPTGLNINIAQNANDFLFASIHEVIKTLIEAFVLVFIVVYIFLQDMRSTLIPAIAIPVALVATFFVLKLIGFSVNLLTLSAMVLAIAIVVDDAIVVVEGVHAKLDQGYKSSREASIDAMSELGGAIVSITLVMMSVFIPVSFMGGTAGNSIASSVLPWLLLSVSRP